MRTANAGDDAIALDDLGFGVAERSEGEGRVVVRLAGELDAATAPRLHDVLIDLIDGGTTAVLDVDLAELDFIDSTGLGTIVRARQRIRAHGGDLRLCHPRPSVAKVLEISGLAEALPSADAQP